MMIDAIVNNQREESSRRTNAFSAIEIFDLSTAFEICWAWERSIVVYLAKIALETKLGNLETTINYFVDHNPLADLDLCLPLNSSRVYVYTTASSSM